MEMLKPVTDVLETYIEKFPPPVRSHRPSVTPLAVSPAATERRSSGAPPSAPLKLFARQPRPAHPRRRALAPQVKEQLTALEAKNPAFKVRTGAVPCHAPLRRLIFPNPIFASPRISRRTWLAAWPSSRSS